MTPVERDDLNKRIAEDLGWAIQWHQSDELWFDPNGQPWGYVGMKDPNFFTDPTMTLLLMEKGRIGVEPVGDKWEACIKRLRKYGEARSAMPLESTIGEAIALAYARMRGLK